jgi:hypothetical protein
MLEERAQVNTSALGLDKYLNGCLAGYQTDRS